MTKQDEANVKTSLPFASYGLDSSQSVELSAELEDMTGQCLEPTIIWDYPSIDKLVDYLVGDAIGAGQASACQDDMTEPIAIIGMSCRFPGAPDLDAYWKLLKEGGVAIADVPRERWDTIEEQGMKKGGFICNIDQFDASFFEISPREAARMDPQQRLLLETSWEAIEDAKEVPARWAGRRIGVFVGIAQNDYAQLQLSEQLPADAYFGSGNALSIAANRLSYFYGFRGPSMAIDTACSSSLVAVHQACQSIRNGECEAALAGGAGLMLSPAISAHFSKTGFLSSSGACRPFDRDADGYVRGEGVGVVVLKPLSAALRDGNEIYAVIRGGAVNNDGSSNGLMAPNGQAQEELLREAYRRAGITPASVGYVEAHGTGTSLGDPIELKALGAVLGEQRGAERKCSIGAVKANIGHLEAAAGIAGLIKTALMLKHSWLVPTANYKTANPYIPMDRLAVSIQQQSEPWNCPEEEKRIAGISSFGFGGTNCHLVLEQAPEAPASLSAEQHQQPEQPERMHYMLLSARSEASLRAMARLAVSALTRAEANPSLTDLCYTLCARHSHHDHRIAVIGHAAADIAASLHRYINNEPSSMVYLAGEEQSSADIEAEIRHVCRSEDGLRIANLAERTIAGTDHNTRAEVIAKLYILGCELDWESLYPEGRAVNIPPYPWDRKRYWFKAAGGEAELPGEAEAETELEAYYESLAQDLTAHEQYLSFAPFAQADPSFSWVLALSEPSRYPDSYAAMSAAQAEMRRVMFRHVKWDAVKRMMEIGCGYGSDLIKLAQSQPHLSLTGYNISDAQIAIARERVSALSLENRIQFFKRDVQQDALSKQYECALAVQILHHLPDKRKALGTMASHLAAGGLIVMAEMMSNTSERLEHPQSSAYYDTKEEWANLLAEHQLQVLDCIDASREVGNFLDDPQFYDNVLQLQRNRSETVRNHLEGPHLLGGLLRRKVVTYGLITVQKTSCLHTDSLRKLNLERLNHAIPYPVAAGWSGETAHTTDISSTERRTVLKPDDQAGYERMLRDAAAEVLEIDPERLDINRSLDSLGLDSIMAIDLKQKIERQLELALPVTELLQGPSIRQLAIKLTEAAFEETAAADTVMSLEDKASGATSPEQLLASLDNLPKEELERLKAIYLQDRGEQK